MNAPEAKATIFPLYAVPMMQCHVPDAARLNTELSRLFLALEAEGDRHRHPLKFDTQYGIYESNFFLHQRSEASVQQLFGFIRTALGSFIQSLNQLTDAQMDNVQLDMHSWFHVTRNGGFQSAHNHPNASWSAIYCVDPGDATAPESGAVRFLDPRTGADMFRDPANSQLQTPYQLGPWQLSHKAGQMMVFPSYLLHEVFPYTGTRPRIVVALNAWSRWKAPHA